MTKKFRAAAAGLTALVTSTSIAACSSASLSGIAAWGQPALIEKFSGGKLVYAGISEGKINNEANSDGYYFADKCNAGRLVEVSGDVVITRPDPLPSCAEVIKKIEGPRLGLGS